MIKLIAGNKGSGKTKQMITMINEALERTNGSIVCIEKGMKSTYNITSAVRLIDVDDYDIRGYTMFYGFLMGVLAGNYDIEEVYIDGILKIGEHDIEGLGELLDQISGITREELKVVVTVSADLADLTDGVKKYI
jgi:hypothetical protein